MVTEASHYLLAVAERAAAGYVARTGPRAILVTGSAAEGVSDSFSDLDLIAYYDRLPTDDQLAAAHALVQATDIRASSGRATESTIEEYVLQDIECQVAHFTIASWERDMASVLEEFAPATHAEKAIMGLLDGVALHGDDLIKRWQARAATYPEGLGRVCKPVVAPRMGPKARRFSGRRPSQAPDLATVAADVPHRVEFADTP